MEKANNRVGGYLFCVYRNNFILCLVISWNVFKRNIKMRKMWEGISRRELS